MIAADNYSVPLDLNIRLMVKPRRLSGVLLSIHSKQPGQLTDDYLVLQMVNGDVSSLWQTINSMLLFFYFLFELSPVNNKLYTYLSRINSISLSTKQ